MLKDHSEVQMLAGMRHFGVMHLNNAVGGILDLLFD
jgi:hypothetical protein